MLLPQLSAITMNHHVPSNSHLPAPGKISSHVIPSASKNDGLTEKVKDANFASVCENGRSVSDWDHYVIYKELTGELFLLLFLAGGIAAPYCKRIVGGIFEVGVIPHNEMVMKFKHEHVGANVGKACNGVCAFLG